MKSLSNWHAIILGLCIGLCLSFFTLPVWVAGTINLAREGNRSDWLGFVGGIAGALATLTAGAAALFAAYKTLAPVKAQLDQLIRQNDHNLIDRLSVRATKLNDEEIVVQKVAANCEVISIALRRFDGGPFTNNKQAIAGLREAVERFEKSVEDMQKQKGEVWGDIATQAVRRRFTDLALKAGSQAIRLITTAEESNIGIGVISPLKPKIEQWKPTSKDVHQIGNQLFQLVQLESRMIGKEIAEVEARLFHQGPTRSH